MKKKRKYLHKKSKNIGGASCRQSPDILEQVIYLHLEYLAKEKKNHVESMIGTDRNLV